MINWALWHEFDSTYSSISLHPLFLNLFIIYWNLQVDCDLNAFILFFFLIDSGGIKASAYWAGATKASDV